MGKRDPDIWTENERLRLLLDIADAIILSAPDACECPGRYHERDCQVMYYERMRSEYG